MFSFYLLETHPDLEIKYKVPKVDDVSHQHKVTLLSNLLIFFLWIPNMIQDYGQPKVQNEMQMISKRQGEIAKITRKW